METKAYDFGPLRFHRGTASFPVRFHAYRGEQQLRFHLVSRSFPFVSRFPPYTRETRNEATAGGCARCQLATRNSAEAVGFNKQTPYPPLPARGDMDRTNVVTFQFWIRIGYFGVQSVACFSEN
jgi:hypothetical protein